MSWSCPHEERGSCVRLKRSCKPASKGCVLEGKVRLVSEGEASGRINAHVFQHVPFEGMGSMADWLDVKGAHVTFTHFFEKPFWPKVEGLDLLIVMGGPMSVNDEADFPWLRLEKEFVRNAISSGVAVLGICMGAQLIAQVLGARVHRNPQKEIGWFPVRGEWHLAGAFRFPKRFLAFHWHGETFDLPPHALRLAGNKACTNQAFQFGSRVVGLQFHLEATRENVQGLLAHCGEELAEGGPYVQSKSALQRLRRPVYDKTNRLMDEVLSFMTRKSEEPYHLRRCGV